MILAPHIIIGIALARAVPAHPVVGFVIAFLSHFVADAIPHSEYGFSKLIDPKYADKEKMVLNRELLWDIFHLSSDFGSGLLISFLLFYDGDSYYIIAGLFGGILPDILQFLYGKFKKEPLIFLKKFHDLAHANKLEGRLIFGILTQIISVILVVLLSYNYFPL